jgi:hypothetical protein
VHSGAGASRSRLLGERRLKDATTDEVHAGEPGYLACIFGDKARAYVAREPHWVDVMKGKTFCEIIVGMPTDQFVDADWMRGGAKACLAAFAAR